MKEEILALIPARSGSKSVINKNIRLIAGKPMLAYSIEHAKQSAYITRVVLSTDSEEYARIGREYGAEVPFLRPEEYATDNALDFDVFYHALKYLEEKENYIPKLVVQLRPTYPVRCVRDIDAMIEKMLGDDSIDSMRCVAPAKETPYKMWRLDENGFLEPLMKDIVECYNMPRQALPPVYYQNACIDIIKTETITKMHSMSGKKIAGYQMSENYDIDTEEDFKCASLHLLKQSR